MKLKSEAHEYSSMLFERDCVPPKIVVDNSKDQSLGKFASKCRKADFHFVIGDPYYPLMMDAKVCIKHLKQGLSRKMLKSTSPKWLWDHCIELEALIRSNNDLDIYGLEGQVPETVMTGQSANISNLCEYERFQLVMYYQTKERYPDDKLAMGRYLGPVIDVGNAINYKILFPDSNYFCRLTSRPWIPVEKANPVFPCGLWKYMPQVQDALGAACNVGDVQDAVLTPGFEYYADDVEDGFEDTPDDILPTTPEVNNNYVGTNVLLLRGNNMAQGRVRKSACDSNGNPIGGANENPILDSREYVFEFKDGIKEELAANAIDRRMYDQCDPDGNTYVLFGYITDFRRSTTILYYADQTVRKVDVCTFLR